MNQRQKALHDLRKKIQNLHQKKKKKKTTQKCFTQQLIEGGDPQATKYRKL